MLLFQQHRTIHKLLIGTLGIFLMAVTSLRAQEEEKDVPYVPSPKPVVEKMLELADVQKGDYVIDLGSGDGRIVIEAARMGADGHGVEIDPSKVSEARNNAKRAGVIDRVRFLEQDLFKSDISRASVVTLYLLPSINVKLRDRLIEQLEAGTKVVSHRFDMDEWKPDKRVTVDVDSDSPGFLYDKTATMSMQHKTHEVFYWVIPAEVEGSWSWSTDNHQFNMDVKQQFQQVQVELTRDGETLQVNKPVLNGARFRVRAETRNSDYTLNGRVEGNAIKGLMQVRSNGDSRVENWEATR